MGWKTVWYLFVETCIERYYSWADLFFTFQELQNYRAKFNIDLEVERLLQLKYFSRQAKAISQNTPVPFKGTLDKYIV